MTGHMRLSMVVLCSWPGWLPCSCCMRTRQLIAVLRHFGCQLHRLLLLSMHVW